MPKQFTSNEDVTVRLFKSDALEFFTHVHPALPAAIFLPVAAYMLFLTTQTGLGGVAIWGMFAAGILAWTLIEYMVHRFLFHPSMETQERVREIVSSDPDKPVISRLESVSQKYYFLAHGVHHDFPSDSRRLVLAPTLSIPLSILFYFSYRALMGPELVAPFFAAFLLGYVFYDTNHFLMHHVPPKTVFGRFLKKHHFRHHYKTANRNFGVTSPLWDIIFRTYDKPAKAKQT